jgi:hypothetical protein
LLEHGPADALYGQNKSLASGFLDLSVVGIPLQVRLESRRNGQSRSQSMEKARSLKTAPSKDMPEILCLTIKPQASELVQASGGDRPLKTMGRQNPFYIAVFEEKGIFLKI